MTDRQTSQESQQSKPARNPRITQFADSIRPGHVAAGIALALALVLGVLAARAPQRLPDFSAIEDIPTLKQTFFEYLAPVVESENERVLERRTRLLELAEQVRAGDRVGWLDRRWLAGLAEEYGVTWAPDLAQDDRIAAMDRLKRRVDAVPVPLALVQAATESGWGRSRFATEGNNLFGHWCFTQGCGLVPSQRNSGAGHEVAAFDSVSDSVSRYIHNLNTHAAYAPLRAIRARLREEGESPTAMALAGGLVQYSERRDAYVDEIRTVIRINKPIIQQVRETL